MCPFGYSSFLFYSVNSLSIYQYIDILEISSLGSIIFFAFFVSCCALLITITFTFYFLPLPQCCLMLEISPKCATLAKSPIFQHNAILSPSVQTLCNFPCLITFGLWLLEVCYFVAKYLGISQSFLMFFISN